MIKNQDIFDSIFQVARLIPKGRVTSYGAIAQYLGMKSGARMVGWAMHAAPSQKEPVPAHRVVNSQGLLTGQIHFVPHTRMQELLEAEGIKVRNNKVQNFKEVFWNPVTELAL